MQKSILLDVNAEPELVFDVLSDLKNYPLWLSFIQKVENTDIHESWMVTLRSQIGPFSRLKKLRMRRTLSPSTRSVLFHRDEVDGKDHSNWLLRVRIDEIQSTQCLITLELEYSGKFWSKTLENILDSEVAKAAKRLEDYLEVEK
jgi:ribosome-associated toxin RatA of RatAB toxin-antitoxin module|tara:strand:- start:76 stop:510 length:435 start_codon:yes stop_codon:yes gene_type:complete